MSSAKQSKGLKRNVIDKYYTKPTIVELCINNILTHINNIKNRKNIIIEPSAGNGSFIPKIKELFNNYMFYDIEPESEDITKQDYLKLNVDNYVKQYKEIHIIGNPPFGRQSSSAIKFIKKSCVFCKSLSFILPKSFKKESLKKHFPINFHLILEIDLPYNSFLVNNIEYNVPCIFQIWEKKDIPRDIIEKLKPINFTFVKKEEKHDISFRRVGINAGVIDKNTDNKSIQSHYFITFNEVSLIDNDDIINKLKNINFNSSTHTVGPKSISKQELIKEYNSILA
jgi:hypothetical protein